MIENVGKYNIFPQNWWKKKKKENRKFEIKKMYIKNQQLHWFSWKMIFWDNNAYKRVYLININQLKPKFEI